MQSNSTRIAKNTLILYFRQILIMLVSLYTVRLKLEILGVEDYGIYNLVAGFVVMFAFLNMAMTNATQRFLNFAMGQNDKEEVRNIFSVSLIIHVFIAFSVIILAETIGLWLFYTMLNIPPERASVAVIVYQFSVVATAINILLVPYRSIIIAYEKMSFFALISVFEALSKLTVVFLLTVIFYDKLTVYAFFVFIISLIIFFIHKLYCNKMFETSRFRHCRNKELFRQIVVFSWWNVFGEIANLFRTNGLQVLVNVFFGVIVNAAMAIATQVSAAVFTFVSNFQTAFRPQIMKSYAAKEHAYFAQLILQTSKISCYLLLIFAIPLYANLEFVFKLWLKTVPENAVIFTQLMLINSLAATLCGPLIAAIHATGDIKKIQIIVGFFDFANLPVALLFLWLGCNSEIVLYIKIFLDTITLSCRVSFLNKKINFQVINYLLEVIIPAAVIVIFSGLLNILLRYYFFDWPRLILSCILSAASIIILVYSIGLKQHERLFLRNFLFRKIKGDI